LTRPELSVLIAVVKGDLKQTLAGSFVPDEPGIRDLIYQVFPALLVERFGDELQNHQLRRELIATRVANDLVNHMGMTFVERLQQSTGATVPSIAQAYVIAKTVFRLDEWWQRVESLDYAVESDLQIRIQSELMRLVRRATRWLLRNRRSEMNIQTHIGRFQGSIDAMTADLPSYIGDTAVAEWNKAFNEFSHEGVPDDVAGVVAGTPYLLSAPGIIEAQEETGLPLQEVANLYFAVGDALALDWFARAVSALAPKSHWEALARESFREDLTWQQRALTIGILRSRKPDQGCRRHWMPGWRSMPA